VAIVTARPRLLFLCQTLPYPPDGGVWIRTYHVMRLLARAFDITALCFERAGHPGGQGPGDTRASVNGLSRFADAEVFRLPQQHSRLRFVWDHARSVARRRVYTTYLYESSRFRRRLAEHLGLTEFNLVHVDSLDLARYLPACAHLPVVCVHHDVESDLLRRRAKLDVGRWRGAYLGYQSRLMRAVEGRWSERIALNVAVSDRDRVRLQQIAPAARVAVVPNGVDVEEFRPTGDVRDGTGIAFVGGAQPAPNLDALDFFCGRILPHLRQRSGAIPVRWIGRATSEQQQYYLGRYGVTLSGYVDDARPLMQEAACHVVPIRMGGGTRLKILSAWAMGKAVVSTSIGCEGLAAVDGSNVLIRDEPAAFAAAVAAVLDSPTLRDDLARHGRDTVERLYDWEAVGQDLIETYLSVATPARAVATLHAPRNPVVSCSSG
jgi:glycosyltransferase involved in cell wall biosynthesis